MKVHFIAVSQNAKTGPIPVSIIERASCWPGCALYENGCYAETGILALHWDRVSRGLAGGSWSEFCAKIAALRPGRLWRYGQAGDLPGYGPAIDGAMLQELVAANTGKSVIAFTHKPVLGDDAVSAREPASDRRFRRRRLHGQSLGQQPRASGPVGRAGDRPGGDRARPRLCAQSSPAPVQAATRPVGRDDRRMARPHGILAPAHARGQANCDLPGDLQRRHLQELWRLRPCPRCRDRLSGAWRLAQGRSRHRGPRRRVSANPGRSATTARWPKSSPTAQQQPDAFTLQICGSGGSRRQSIPLRQGRSR